MIRKRNSLYFQLTFALWSVAIISCISGGLLSGLLVLRNVRMNMKDQLEQSMSALINITSGMRHEYEQTDLPTIARHILSLRVGKIVRIFDAHHHTIFSNLPSSDIRFLDRATSWGVLGGREELSIIQTPDRDYATIRGPYILASGEPRYVQLAVPIPKFSEILAASIWQYLLLIAILFTVLAFLSNWMVSRLLSPVKNIAQHLRTLKAKDFKKWLPIPQRGDSHFLEDIIEAANNLISKTQEVSIFQENMARSIAHEIRTPLTAMLGEIETSQTPEMNAESYRRLLGSFSNDILHIDSITKTILDLGGSGRRRYTYEPKACDLGALVHECIEQFERVFRKDVHMEVRTRNLNSVLLDKDLFRIVVDNLLRNSYKHAGAESIIRVMLNEEEAAIAVEISDTGPGLSPEILRVANSSVPWASQLGVGLNLCKQICQITGWKCVFENLSTGGLKVSLQIPRS